MVLIRMPAPLSVKLADLENSFSRLLPYTHYSSHLLAATPLSECLEHSSCLANAYANANRLRAMKGRVQKTVI